MRALGIMLAVATLVAIGCAREMPVQPSVSSQAATIYRSTPGHLPTPGALDRFAARIAAAAARGGPTTNSNIVNVPLFIEDASHHAPSGSDTPLYEVREHNPILAPDRHQVTLGEWNAVRGSASVKCVPEGTHAVLHLTGLIPNGVYTLWNLTFKDPGFDPTFANLIGLGAAGPADGSRNTIRATDTGEASLSAITPGGPLSIFGTIADCALTGEFEFHMVGAYHIDGVTYGATPGPDGTFVEQFGFIFRR